jgi:hypothetical protein
VADVVGQVPTPDSVTDRHGLVTFSAIDSLSASRRLVVGVCIGVTEAEHLAQWGRIEGKGQGAGL